MWPTVLDGLYQLPRRNVRDFNLAEACRGVAENRVVAVLADVDTIGEFVILDESG